MELFSKVHCKYYNIIAFILDRAQKGGLRAKEINEMIQEHGFAESLFSLSPRLLNHENDESYNLFVREEGLYHSILKTSPQKLLTTFQKRWLKSLMNDRRILLFLNDDDIRETQDLLKDVQPLFESGYVSTVDVAADGDPYSDPNYIKHFRTLIHAIRNQQCVRIRFLNSEGRPICADYAPFRMEYSIKDDKFRFSGVRIYNKKLMHFNKVNIVRIQSISILDNGPSFDNVANFIQAHKVTEPIVIEVNNERNGFERCFMHLSNFERNSEYDENTNTCSIKIFYYDFDEPELMITLLSFGPIIKVSGPEAFKQKIIARIHRQKQLFS